MMDRTPWWVLALASVFMGYVTMVQPKPDLIGLLFTALFAAMAGMKSQAKVGT